MKIKEAHPTPEPAYPAQAAGIQRVSSRVGRASAAPFTLCIRSEPALHASYELSCAKPNQIATRGHEAVCLLVTVGYRIEAAVEVPRQTVLEARRTTCVH